MTTTIIAGGACRHPAFGAEPSAKEDRTPLQESFKAALARTATQSTAGEMPDAHERRQHAGDEVQPARSRVRMPRGPEPECSGTGDQQEDTHRQVHALANEIGVDAMRTSLMLRAITTDMPEVQKQSLESTIRGSLECAGALTQEARASLVQRRLSLDSDGIANRPVLNVLNEETHFAPTRDSGPKPSSDDPATDASLDRSPRPLHFGLPPTSIGEDIAADVKKAEPSADTLDLSNLDVAAQVFEATRKQIEQERSVPGQSAPRSNATEVAETVPQHRSGGHLKLLKVQLSPEAFGSMRISMVSESGVISLRVEAERPDVASRLEMDRAALASRIVASGFELAELTVSCSAFGSDGSGQLHSRPDAGDQRMDQPSSGAGSMHHGSASSRGDREHAGGGGSRSGYLPPQGVAIQPSEFARPQASAGRPVSRRFNAV